MKTPPFRSLVELLRHRADAQGDSLAYAFLLDGEADEARIGFAGIDRRARAIAARLQQLDAAGQRALLLYAPGLDYIAAFFGCLYAGVIAVPAYPPRNARALPRIKAIAADAGASLLLAGEQDIARMRPMAAELPDLQRLDWVATDQLPEAMAGDWRPLDIPPEAIAFLQYTSGSTGEPKGVVLSHGNLLDNSAMIARAFETSPQSVGLSWLPPYHDMGLIGGILQPLYAGYPTWLMAPAMFLQRPLRWLQGISRLRATHSGGPDFAYDLCARKLDAEQCAGLDLSCWRAAFNGAEPVRAATLARFAEAFGGLGFDRRRFLPCYGLAEATLFVTGTHGTTGIAVDARALERNVVEPVGDDAAATMRLVSSGPLAESPGTCVVDPATGRPCAEGQVGEIWVRNPGVAQGYWRKPELSEQVFGARLADGSGPYLRTGDLGAAHAGLLYVTGRIKDVLIVHGRNLYPTDIEAAVQACDAALRPGFGVAVGVEAGGEERLVVLQELEFRRKPDLEATRRAIVRTLAEAFEVVPHAVLLLKAGTLPVTSSGKLRRREAKAMFLRGELSPLHAWQGAEEAQAPRAASPSPSGLAAMLAARIAARLRVAPEAIDIDLPFTDFGLGSVEAVALSGELEQQLGRRLPPTLLWDHPSIRQLATHLEGEGGAAPQPAAAQPLLAEPIAVVGMACRFPGAPDLEAYWRLLCEGVDAISEVPADRWSNDALYEPGAAGKLATRWGGFIDGIEAFDAGFFGIAPKEAQQIDPQQRLLLETAWHALEHAGCAPAALAGSATGVYVGISNNDHARRLAGRFDAIDAHVGTGNANSLAANRISYQLGLQGPSMAVDTACSSSLVAVHLACQGLRLGETDLALAAGVNLMLEPDLTIAFSQAGMMAADGRCKTFDARADGYVRGEGCGVVVLKRLSDAQRDGDTVLALLRGSAVNQSGRSNGLTAPSRAAQRAVIQRALSQAGVEPQQVGYVEAHGTGTALGDPIEIQALVEAVGGEGRAQPCAVGSVKTNIGHLEAAAGIAGFIKAVLMLQHGMLAPHLHVQKLNPRLRRAELPLAVPQALQPWIPPEGMPRIAGVSSFGFGGSNAHAVLQEPPVPLPTEADGSEPAVQLLALSARSDEALRELARRYRAFLAGLPPQQLADACYSANTGRNAFGERLCVLGASPAALAEALDAFLLDRPDARWQRGSAPPSAPAEALRLDPAEVFDEARRLTALARLAGRWIAGAAIEWAGLYPARRRRIALPAYPFRRERHWAEAALPRAHTVSAQGGA